MCTNFHGRTITTASVGAKVVDKTNLHLPCQPTNDSSNLHRIPCADNFVNFDLPMLRTTIKMEDQTSTPLYVARLVHHGAIQSPTKLATRMIQSTDRLNEIKASLQQLVTQPETQATANDTLGKINQQIEGHRKLETLLVQVGAIGEFIYFSKLPLVSRGSSGPNIILASYFLLRNIID